MVILMMRIAPGLSRALTYHSPFCPAVFTADDDDPHAGWSIPLLHPRALSHPPFRWSKSTSSAHYYSAAIANSTYACWCWSLPTAGSTCTATHVRYLKISIPRLLQRTASVATLNALPPPSSYDGIALLAAQLALHCAFPTDRRLLVHTPSTHILHTHLFTPLSSPRRRAHLQCSIRPKQLG